MQKNFLVILFFIITTNTIRSQNKTTPYNAEISWGIRKYINKTAPLIYENSLQINRYINNFIDLYTNASISYFNLDNISSVKNITLQFNQTPIYTIQIGTKIYADELTTKIFKSIIPVNDNEDFYPISLWLSISSGIETYDVFKNNFWVNSLGLGIRYKLGKYTAIQFHNMLSIVNTENNYHFSSLIQKNPSSVLFFYNAICSFTFDMILWFGKMRNLDYHNPYKIKKGTQDIDFKNQFSK